MSRRMPFPIHTASTVVTLLLSAGLAACGGIGPAASPESALGSTPLEGSFVPVYRGQSEVADLEASRRALLGGASAGGASDRHFYVAVHRKELRERWFLSVFLEQFYPLPQREPVALSLGTMVVSFKEQNGKLFLFDVREGAAFSDTFDPQRLLEAYPIVKDFEPFNRRSNASDYVLLDPAAGINQMSVLNEGTEPVRVDLSYSQRFERVKDGVTFEQVFTGLRDYKSRDDDDQPVVYTVRTTGTLSFGLRRYNEGDGYVPQPLQGPMYLPGASGLVKNEGTINLLGARWNLRPGGKPITWVISGNAEKLRRQPHLAHIDFAAAIKEGIEIWNQAFGWKALEGRLERTGESYGDDEVNYLVFDGALMLGTAFAHLRNNPNTGEVRGAGVYAPLGFFGDQLPAPQSPPGVARTGQSEEGEDILTFTGAPARAGLPSFRWGNREAGNVCNLRLPSYAEVVAAEPPPGAPALSPEEKLHKLIVGLVAHEIGHTLGLGHNFKGSMKEIPASVMDYLDPSDELRLDGKLGSYDVAAIRFLYGLSAEPPTDLFCPGEETESDPDCKPYDLGARPLTDWAQPRWNTQVTRYLAGQGGLGATYLDALAQHARQGRDEADRLSAWEALIGPIEAPLTVPADAPRGFATRVDNVTRGVFQRFMVGFYDWRGSLVGPQPPLPPDLVVPVNRQLQAFLLNVDGLRSFVTRRQAADLLKQQQNVVALSLLLEAREELAAQLPGLSGAAQLQTLDLVRRLDKHLTPYYN